MRCIFWLALLAHVASSLIIPSSVKPSWGMKNNVRSSRLMSTTAPEMKDLSTTVLHLRGGSTGAVNSLAGHMLIGAALGGVGDVFAQQSEATEGILTLKKKRFLGYLLFGTLVKGCCQHYLYGYWLPSLGSNWVQFAVDQFVWGPLGYYPLYYIIAGGIRGIMPHKSVQLYASEAKLVLPTYYTFWIPLQVFSFGFLAKQYRASFSLLASVFWVALMSRKQRKMKLLREKEAKVASWWAP
mmetsp:Transcript_86958/g.173972  ORF Transcript_86958/g.173972 Transcript_86958/m.173972 type:complete len:240 (+) Transcript_86958:80-799(+)